MDWLGQQRQQLHKEKYKELLDFYTNIKILPHCLKQKRIYELRRMLNENM